MSKTSSPGSKIPRPFISFTIFLKEDTILLFRGDEYQYCLYMDSKSTVCFNCTSPQSSHSDKTKGAFPPSSTTSSSLRKADGYIFPKSSATFSLPLQTLQFVSSFICIPNPFYNMLSVSVFIYL